MISLSSVYRLRYLWFIFDLEDIFFLLVIGYTLPTIIPLWANLITIWIEAVILLGTEALTSLPWIG